jgi:hypothetical protein
MLDGHRLAITYVEAMTATDADQAGAIVSTLEGARLRRNFLIGLTTTAHHALQLTKRDPHDTLHAYRDQLDQAEQQAHDNGQDTPLSFGIYRLAATYLSAVLDNDDDLTADVLAIVTDNQDRHSLYAGLVGIIEHALTYRPGSTPAAFVAAYRASLDQAERKAS